MPNYNSTLQTNNSSLEEIITQLNNLPNAPETVAQATPAITVNQTTGLITATATQTAGYVPAGTKSATHQLAFQPAKTITPGTTNQTAVAANTYVGGAVTVAGDANLKAENIVNGKTIFGVTGTATTGGGGDDPFAPVTPFTYTVDAVSGATYGFALNSNGYYESQNKGKNSTYAICRVNLTVTETSNITFDVINYAESNYDYALFSELDFELNLNNSADTSNVKKNFKGQQSASVVNVVYENVTAGNHTIDVKFIKDTSQHDNNDSVQFKIQDSEGGLSQETIDKILSADPDLVASNIRAGVDIFGVVGTVTGDGDHSMEDALVTRTLATYTNDRITEIGVQAFAGCVNLVSVSFPKCSLIKNEGLARCTALTTISFPRCREIGFAAFSGCTNLKTVSFPICLSISTYAFYGCAGLVSVYFPKRMYVAYSAFQACRSLTTVEIPQCLGVYSSAFFNCTGLTSINFPICEAIDSAAFMRCAKLTSINLPKCTTIGLSAFESCTSLTSISLPACKKISYYAFKNCTQLLSIYLGSTSVCSLDGSTAFSNTGIWSNKGSIFVRASLVSAYKAATNWAFFSNRIFSYAF